MTYLIRRAAENKSIMGGGATASEIRLVLKELSLINRTHRSLRTSESFSSISRISFHCPSIFFSRRLGSFSFKTILLFLSTLFLPLANRIKSCTVLYNDRRRRGSESRINFTLEQWDLASDHKDSWL